MRALAVFYWFPVIIVTFYASFGFSDHKGIGYIILLVTTAMAFVISYKLSGLSFIEWYHEIVMCGTDKISMSITILSNPDGSRSWWMIPFESYFGLLVKFMNPPVLLFFICEGLASDLAEPYGITKGYMTMFASIYVFIAALIVFSSLIMCEYREMFMHNVEKEFSADDVFETKNRIKKKMERKMRKQASKEKNAGETELANKNN